MQRATLALCAALIVTGVRLAHADTDRQTRTIALQPGQAITLEITNGHVRIEGWSRGEAALEVTRTAPDAAALARIPIDITSDGDVRISARQTGGGTDPALRTDVTLRVPHDVVLKSVRIMEGRLQVRALGGAITAEVRRGPIEAEDVQGEVRLETSIGHITASGMRLSPQGLLRLRTFNGNVRLQLAERPANARVMALALNGTITSQIPLRMKDAWGPRWGEATLGAGEPVISIDVITGRIEITAPPG
jgi:hypothetical protein